MPNTVKDLERTFLLFFFNPCPRTFVHCFQRELKGERNTDAREKHRPRPVASCTHEDWGPQAPGLGPNPKPRCVPCWGIEPATFWLPDDAPANCAILARARENIS